MTPRQETGCAIPGKYPMKGMYIARRRPYSAYARIISIEEVRVMERKDRDTKEEYNLCGEVYAGTNRQDPDDEVTAMLRLKNLAYLCIHDPSWWQQGPGRVTRDGTGEN